MIGSKHGKHRRNRSNKGNKNGVDGSENWFQRTPGLSRHTWSIRSSKPNKTRWIFVLKHLMEMTSPPTRSPSNTVCDRVLADSPKLALNPREDDGLQSQYRKMVDRVQSIPTSDER